MGVDILGIDISSTNPNRSTQKAKYMFKTLFATDCFDKTK